MHAVLALDLNEILFGCMATHCGFTMLGHTNAADAAETTETDMGCVGCAIWQLALKELARADHRGIISENMLYAIQREAPCFLYRNVCIKPGKGQAAELVHICP